MKPIDANINWIVIGILSLCLLSPLDHKIRSAVHTLLPLCGDACDWRWIRAQIYVESGLRPDALSPAGAQGIAQIMPGTWERYASSLGLSSERSVYDTDYAVYVAVYVMRDLWDEWTAERTTHDRMALARASYNAGLGHILRAQEMCGGCTDYDGIIAELPHITGRHASETIEYENRIQEQYNRWNYY